MFSRDGSLLPAVYADARCIDAVVVSKGQRCAWMGEWGDWVEPYTYTVGGDGHYTLSHNVEVMQQFYERAPPEVKPALAAGGPQSLRSRPQNLVEMAAGGFPSANYGSTLEGVLQMAFSMGDKADKIGPVCLTPLSHRFLPRICSWAPMRQPAALCFC